VSGHGPGFTPLLTGPAERLVPLFIADANLAPVMGVRRASPLRAYPTLAEQDAARLARRAAPRTVLFARRARARALRVSAAALPLF
jgi:hypothetical protein